MSAGAPPFDRASSGIVRLPWQPIPSVAQLIGSMAGCSGPSLLRTFRYNPTSDRFTCAYERVFCMCMNNGVYVCAFVPGCVFVPVCTLTLYEVQLFLCPFILTSEMIGHIPVT